MHNGDEIFAAMLAGIRGRGRRSSSAGRTVPGPPVGRRRPTARTGPAEQVLHGVRGGFPGPPGDGPAVLAWQVRQ
ncbi:hypothetical protein CGZ69_01480 [Streptomyces peucetius subsp. caesius ATCC 27952]|nr:hypothetical protein CGZ69_01480 [Streptomyces peucetius subsp. caesius ATCC 27952]